MLGAVKKIGLFAAGVASQRYMAALQDQQEVMADLADIIYPGVRARVGSAAGAQAGGCGQVRPQR